jgi:hypothetical protein
MPKLFQARPRSPAWTLVLFTATALVGVLAIQVASHSFGPGGVTRCIPDAASVTTLSRLALVAWALAWCVALVTVLAAYVVARLSVLTLRTGTFPPPGTRTLRPIPVLVGPAATRRAVSGFFFAIILLGFAVLLPALMTTLAQRLLPA